MPRPGIDKYREIYQPEDIPSSKPPPEPQRIKILKAGAFVMLAVLLIGVPIYYYASQRGILVFMDEDEAIQVAKGKELVAVRQLVKEGKLVRALEVIRTLYKLHPRNVEYVSTGAWVHFKMEQYRRALELSEQAVQIDPGRASDHALMGACRLFFKQYPGALENSLKALELDPEQPLAYLTLGEVFLKQGDTERALPALKKAGRLDPDNPRVWTRLSSAFIRLEQWHRAELAAQRALKLKPDAAGGHFNLAMIYYKAEQKYKAVAHMQRAEDLYQRAEQHEWAGKARQNKELIIRKFKLRPEDIIH